MSSDGEGVDAIVYWILFGLSSSSLIAMCTREVFQFYSGAGNGWRACLGSYFDAENVFEVALYAGSVVVLFHPWHELGSLGGGG